MTFEPSYHDDQVEDNHADDNDIHLDDDEEAKMLPHAIHSPHQQQHLKSTLATTSNGRAPYILLTAVVVSCVIGSLSIMSRQQQTTGEYLNLRAPTTTATLLDNATNSSFSLPWELLDLGIYDPKVDFVNEIGISPPYWEENDSKTSNPHMSTMCIRLPVNPHQPTRRMRQRWEGRRGDRVILIDPLYNGTRRTVQRQSMNIITIPAMFFGGGHPPKKACVDQDLSLLELANVEPQASIIICWDIPVWHQPLQNKFIISS